MEENKKVKNAKSVEYEGISFKSKLECSCFKKLREAELDPLYEPTKYILLTSSKLKNGFIYAPHKKELKKYSSHREITYTPDFELDYKGWHIYIDTKGKSNDTYPLKKKLFLHYLENTGIPYIFFEPHNMRQIDQLIQILYELC